MTGTRAKEPLDARIVRATQAGLPLVMRPWAAVAAEAGASEAEVLGRAQAMLADGRIRRVGAVPNHYAIGVKANGMSVWDVDDAALDRFGPQVGALEFVSHCYRRPRHLPDWPYNLFAMVHGRTREEVEAGVERIATLLGPRCRAHETLYSVRILKKTGLRFA